MKIITTYIALIAAIILVPIVQSCDDAPAGPAPYQVIDSISEEYVMDRWVGEVTWGDNDSVDQINVEFYQSLDTVLPDPEADTIQDTVLFLFNITEVEFLDNEQNTWRSTRGGWELELAQRRIKWWPQFPIPNNQRDILYVGYAAGDSLYGFVTTSGYEGTWWLKRQR